MTTEELIDKQGDDAVTTAALRLRIDKLSTGQILAMRAICNASYNREYYIRPEDFLQIDGILTQLEARNA